MLRYILVIGALLLFTNFLRGQVKENNIALLSKSKADGVWLRWAPSNATIWKIGNRHGYNVERFMLKADGELENPSGEKLNSKPIQPFTEAEFNKLSERIEEASVLQEILYGSEATSAVANKRGMLSRKQEIENQFGIALFMCDMSIEVAQAAGLFFVDRSAIKGKKYIYRISVADQTSAKTIDPGINVIVHSDEKPLERISDLKIRPGNQTVTLEWKSLFHRGIYTAYFIEKSENGKDFARISDMPYVHMTQGRESENTFYVDSLAANNRPYYYRISGLTPFGETGPVSNIATASGKDNFSGLLAIQDIKIQENKARITWSFPVNLEPKITGFYLTRSAHSSGPFERIVTTPILTSTREYVDLSPYNNTYYIVKANDAEGREVASSLAGFAHIEDNSPPSTPLHASGVIDKQGVARISWALNTDQDLLGYRVFRCNDLKEEPVEVTQVILDEPSFTDTVNINVLNKKIHYFIVAVDQSYNNSDYSKPLSLTRPDIVSPVAAVFEKAQVENDTIVLMWQNSPSDDIMRYELTKSEKHENIARTVLAWTSLQPHERFMDTSLIPGKTYRYKIVVTDSSGNSIERSTAELFYERGYRPAVSKVRASVDRTDKKITIVWKNPQPSVRCLIYRRKNEANFTLYKTIDGNIEQFADDNVLMNNHYSYKVQPVFQKGIKSKLSDEIVVKF
jgi:uncharacterized protein